MILATNTSQWIVFAMGCIRPILWFGGAFALFWVGRQMPRQMHLWFKVSSWGAFISGFQSFIILQAAANEPIHIPFWLLQVSTLVGIPSLIAVFSGFVGAMYIGLRERQELDRIFEQERAFPSGD